MNPTDKPLVWLNGEVKSPPLSKEARIEAGYLLRLLQAGHSLSLPHSRPMPSVGARCHELRINDENATWRVLYRVDSDAVLVLEVFSKKTAKTPKSVVDTCKQRMKQYDADS
jgi:phage-related protein